MRRRHSTHVSLMRNPIRPLPLLLQGRGRGSVAGPRPAGAAQSQKAGGGTRAPGTGEQTPFVSGRAPCLPPARGQGSWESGRSVCSAASGGRKADVTCDAVLTAIESRGTPHRGTSSFPGTPGSEFRRLPAVGILADVEAGRAASGLHSWAGPGGRSRCVDSVVPAEGWPMPRRNAD